MKRSIFRIQTTNDNLNYYFIYINNITIIQLIWCDSGRLICKPQWSRCYSMIHSSFSLSLSLSLYIYFYIFGIESIINLFSLFTLFKRSICDAIDIMQHNTMFYYILMKILIIIMMMIAVRTIAYVAENTWDCNKITVQIRKDTRDNRFLSFNGNCGFFCSRSPSAINQTLSSCSVHAFFLLCIQFDMGILNANYCRNRKRNSPFPISAYEKSVW